MIVLDSALLAFLFTLKSVVAVDAVAVVGFLVSMEFFLHTYRLRHIAMDAVSRIKTIEARRGLDTTRKDTHLLGLKVPTGSTLLCFLSLVFVVLWLILVALFNASVIPLAN